MSTKPDFPNVDAYVGAQDPAIRERLAHLRGAIRAAAPDAVERIQYRMPATGLGTDSAFAADDEHLNAGKARLRFGPKDDLPPAVFARLLDAIAAASRRGDPKSC